MCHPGGRAHLAPTPRSGPDYLAPIHLHRLIPLIYRHVRPAEDLRPSLGKGAYTPTARDEAQDFRNALWDRLAQSDGAEVEGVLCELADEPVFSSQRDWILHLIDKHAEQHADLLPWTATDIRSFAAEFETEPKTDRELFQIVCRRLTDIKHDVEGPTTASAMNCTRKMTNAIYEGGLTASSGKARVSDIRSRRKRKSISSRSLTFVPKIQGPRPFQSR